MKLLGALLVLSLVASDAVAASSNPVPFPDDATLRHRLSLSPKDTLVFRDMQGKPMDEGAFLAAVNTGHGLTFKPADAAGVVVMTLSSATPPPKPRTQWGDLVVGQSIPAFTLASSEGRTISSSALDHDLTVVSFFFYDCGGCIQEIPALNAFHASHPDIGALALTYDASAQLPAFQKKFGLTWEVVPDAVAFFDKANIAIFPTLGIVDRHGRLLDIRGGYTIHPKGRGLTGEDIAHWVAAVQASSRALP